MLTGLLVRSLFQEDELRSRLEDDNGVRTDVWIYNDIAAATERARRENKPLFVTFRCVPCQACAAFDADVANGNEQVQALAKERFVSVRQVEPAFHFIRMLAMALVALIGQHRSDTCFKELQLLIRLSNSKRRRGQQGNNTTEHRGAPRRNKGWMLVFRSHAACRRREILRHRIPCGH